MRLLTRISSTHVPSESTPFYPNPCENLGEDWLFLGHSADYYDLWYCNWVTLSRGTEQTIVANLETGYQGSLGSPSTLLATSHGDLYELYGEYAEPLRAGAALARERGLI